MAVEYVDYEKLVAERQQAKTQAEKGAFELEQEKKATAAKEAESKGIYDILKGYTSEDTPQAKAPTPTDAGPGGYDPTTQTTGEERQQQASFKDQMAMHQAKSQQMGQEAKMLQQLMLNSAKNNDPEAALKFRAQIDGLQDKYRKSQQDQMTLQKDQAEFQGQMAQGYLANPTDEQWYNVVRQAMKAGLPGAEQLLTVPKDKREAVAKAAIAQSMTTKDQATAALNAAKLKEKSQEFYDGLEVKRMIAENSNRNAALAREIQRERLSSTKDTHNTAIVNAMLGKVTNQLTQAKEDYHEADTEYKEAASRKKDIEGNIIIIRDKEERKRQLAELDDTMAKATAARESAKANRDELNSRFDKLSTMAFPELAAVKEDKPATTKPAAAEAIPAKFKTDPAMKDYKLGKKEADGKYQVLDKNGKLVGHYQ